MDIFKSKLESHINKKKEDLATLFKSKPSIKTKNTSKPENDRTGIMENV